MSSTSSSSSGVGVFGLLGVAFVTLKLCGVIDWSWWWVTAPFWGGFLLVIAILIPALIYFWCQHKKDNERIERINKQILRIERREEA